MEWIKCEDSLKPIENETYWVTISSVTEFVIEATYKNGLWYHNEKEILDVFAWYNVQKPIPCKSPEKEGLIFPAFEVNERGINKKIKVNLLKDEDMRTLGFTDYGKDNWYYCRNLIEDISFSISIPKKNPDEFRIDVLDDNFCQPYDYQSILGRNKNHKFACLIMEKVEKQMEILSALGIISGHNRGEYI